MAKKFVVEHSGLTYRYPKLSDAMRYALILAEEGVSVFYTGKQAQAEEEQVADDKRRAQAEVAKQIESLDPLESAKIARQVSAGFGVSEILDLFSFFESTSQLYDAVCSSHAKLEPEYRKAVLTWYADNTDIPADALSESAEVQAVVLRCMNQGLSAICKSEALSSHLESHHTAGGIHGLGNSGQMGKIEKGRSWREISAEGK
ncbi:hypothetical protein OA010_04545 [Luminiphilus sp.]|nr:hypothetical protein [Luminiphilus sp.]